MYKMLLASHSGFRYIVLTLIVIAVLMALIGLFGKKKYSESNRKINLFTLISAHIQLVIGLVLYFFSPFVKYSDMAMAMKNPALRYWTVEHTVMMVFAIILITVGYSRSKKALDALNKHRAIAIYYGLALLVILTAIYQSGRPLLGAAS